MATTSNQHQNADTDALFGPSGQADSDFFSFGTQQDSSASVAAAPAATGAGTGNDPGGRDFFDSVPAAAQEGENTDSQTSYFPPAETS